MKPNSTDIAIVEHIQKNEACTPTELSKLCGVSKQYIHKRLNFLVSNNILEKRHTLHVAPQKMYYFLTDNFKGFKLVK